MALTPSLARFYEWYHKSPSNKGALLEYERNAFLAGWDSHREFILEQASR